jgi:hypothetical protein
VAVPDVAGGTRVALSALANAQGAVALAHVAAGGQGVGRVPRCGLVEPSPALQ